MKSFLPIILALAIMIIPMVGCGGASPTATNDITGFSIITDVQTDLTRAEPGKPAPIIYWKGSDNVTHNLNEFRGKPVLINTWNVDCYECGLEFPYFQEIVDKYSSSGLVFLSINTLDVPTTTKDYLNKKKCSFTVLLDYQKDLILKKFVLPTRANPYTFFIDSNGLLVNLKMGGFKNTSEIETLLKQNNMVK